MTGSRVVSDGERIVNRTPRLDRCLIGNAKKQEAFGVEADGW